MPRYTLPISPETHTSSLPSPPLHSQSETQQQTSVVNFQQRVLSLLQDETPAPHFGERPPPYTPAIEVDTSHEISISTTHPNNPATSQRIEQVKNQMFHYAATGNAYELQILLRDNGQYIATSSSTPPRNALNEDPAVVAYKQNHPECVSILLMHFLRPASYSLHTLCLYYESHGLRPPFHAIEQNNENLLRECTHIYGSHLSECRNNLGYTVLMQLILNKEKPHPLLLSNLALLNAQTSDGLTALMLAISMGQKSSYETILRYDPNISLQMNTGTNALHLALNQEKHDSELINALIDRIGFGLMAESKEYGNMLCIAVARNNLKLFRKFKQYVHMRIDSVNSSGDTCLDIAIAAYLKNPNPETLSTLDCVLTNTGILALNYSYPSQLKNPLISAASTPSSSRKHNEQVISMLLSACTNKDLPSKPLFAFTKRLIDHPLILHTFIESGIQYTNIKKLLELGFDLSNYDIDNKQTYLIEAIQHQNKDAFDAILEQIKNHDPQMVNQTNRGQETALIHAILQKSATEDSMLFIPELLTVPQIDILKQRFSDGCSAMMLALKNRRTEQFNTLFKHARNTCYPRKWLTCKNSAKQDIYLISASLGLESIAEEILMQTLKQIDAQEQFDYYRRSHYSPIFLACKHSNTPLLNLCLSLRSPNIHTDRDSEGNNPLMAIIKSRMTIPKQFISAEMLSHQNNQGETPLSLAIANADQANAVINRCIELQIIDRSAFILAAKYGNTSLMQQFSECTIIEPHSLNAHGNTALEELLTPPFNFTSIHYALYHLNFALGYPQEKITSTLAKLMDTADPLLIKKFLQDSQPHLNIQKDCALIALKVCAKTHNPEILNVLLQAGISLNEKSFHPIVDEAIKNHNYDTLSWLITHQQITPQLLELFDLDHDDATLLMKVLQDSQCPITFFKTLFSLDFDSSKQLPISKENALIKLLLNVMIKLPQKGSQTNYYQTIFKMLLEHMGKKGDPAVFNFTEETGETALTIATFYEKTQIIKDLLIAGADLSIPNQRETPLEMSIHMASKEITELFISHYKNNNPESIGQIRSSLSSTGILYLANIYQPSQLANLIKIAPIELIIEDLLESPLLEKPSDLINIFQAPEALELLLTRLKSANYQIPQNRSLLFWEAILQESFNTSQDITHLKLFMEIASPLPPYNPNFKDTPLKQFCEDTLTTMRSANTPYNLEALQIISNNTAHITPTLANFIAFQAIQACSQENIFLILDILYTKINQTVKIKVEDSPFKRTWYYPYKSIPSQLSLLALAKDKGILKPVSHYFKVKNASTNTSDNQRT